MVRILNILSRLYSIFTLTAQSIGDLIRKSFSELGGLRALTDVPFIALTASAPPHVKEIIIESLHLKSSAIVCHTLDRPNIFLSISKSTALEVSVWSSKPTI